MALEDKVPWIRQIVDICDEEEDLPSLLSLVV